MKKTYEAPKAVQQSFEAKDIITASSGMLSLGGTNNDGIGGAGDVMTVSWKDWN